MRHTLARLLLATAAVVGVQTRVVQASCNLIPSAAQSFRGTLGTANRPFASPGEMVELRVRPAVCDQGSPGFSGTESQHAVTIVFTPPNGPKNVVVLATDCTGIGTCAGAASTTCLPAGASDLKIIPGEDRLQFRFPDTDGLVGLGTDDHTFTGPATIAVGPRAAAPACGLVTNSCSSQSGLSACLDDLYEIDGTCRRLVDFTFPHFTALPPPNRYHELCHEPQFPNGPCTGGASEIRFAVDTAGNILGPVDWQGILVAGNIPVPRLIRGGSSVDALSLAAGPLHIPGQAFVQSRTPEGALLPPIFLPQIDPTAQGELTLFGSADAPHTVLRISRKSPAFKQCFGGTQNGRPCTEAAQCPGVGATCDQARCKGGPAINQACDEDEDCPSSECGPELFDFRDRLANGGVGPVVIPRFVVTGTGVCEDGADAGDMCSPPPSCAGSANCVDYRLATESPVPLEGLAGTEDVFTFSVSEPVAAADVNDDGDQTDLVLTLQNRETGQKIPIGAGCPSTGCPDGRAITATRQLPFAFPALASEGDVAAFLEPEARQQNPTADKNGDNDGLDEILRVVRLDAGGSSATEVTSALSPPLAVDAALLVNDRSVAVSNGLVFVRAPETAAAQETTIRLSQNGVVGGDRPSLVNTFGAQFSANGRYLTFESLATNLVSPATSGRQIYRYDRDADANGIYDQTGATNLEVVSLHDDESPTQATQSSISANGRFVVYFSGDPVGDGAGPTCPNSPFSPGFPCGQIDLRDIDGGSTEVVSIGPGAVRANGETAGANVSADGRFVVFDSYASNLTAPGVDTNVCGGSMNSGSCKDVFVRDRCRSNNGPLISGCTPQTRLVSLKPDGSQFTLPSSIGSISDDGRYVAFDTTTSIYLRDLVLNTTQLVSAHQVTGVPAYSYWPIISPDGRFVAFQSVHDFGFPGAPVSAWVRDRTLSYDTRGAYDNVGVSSTGEYATGGSGIGNTSDGGRFSLFLGIGGNLVDPPLTQNCNGMAGDCGNFYVRDRLAGTTRLASRGWTGGELNANVPNAAMSRDGRAVIFQSAATNAVAGDTELCDADAGGIDDDPCPDVFLRLLPPTGGGDVTGDLDNNDTVLMVLDGNAMALPTQATALCPAEQVSVANGKAAFLRPEAAGRATGCPGGAPPGPAPDLDLDGFADDLVVQLWDGASVSNLGLAASRVLLSDTYVAAIASTVRVHPVGPGSWSDSGQAADRIGFCGPVVAMLTPEAAQNTVLNGDGLKDDRVLQLYVPATGAVVNVGQAAEEFVCTDGLIAFRTSEAAQNTDLNGDVSADGGLLDYVLQVWDLARPECLTATPPADCLSTTHQAVRNCTLEACDPRIPYRVGQDSVKFLTFECDQGGSVTGAFCSTGGTELNGDSPPDASDLVIQTFNVRTGTSRTIGTVVPGAQNPIAPDPPTSSDAGDDTVYVSSGRCIEPIGGACTTNSNCDNGGFCESGTCKRDQGVCVKQSECPGASICEPRPIVPASPDTDADGIPDHLDNCPNVPNAEQLDGDGDGAGDLCDAKCDGGTPDARAAVKIVTKNARGQLTVRSKIDLPAYAGEPVTVRIDDQNSSPVVSQTIATLPPKGASGKRWQYRTTPPGLFKVGLTDLSPRQPGRFKLLVRAKEWFSAAAADQSPAATTVTVVIGPRCVTRGVTDKTD
jgi:hypothetical protein